MKNIKWAGLSVQMIMLTLMLLLVFLHQPIPDFVMIIFVGGMLTCIISSLRENETQKRSISLKGKYH